MKKEKANNIFEEIRGSEGISVVEKGLFKCSQTRWDPALQAAGSQPMTLWATEERPERWANLTAEQPFRAASESSEYILN